MGNDRLDVGMGGTRTFQGLPRPAVTRHGARRLARFALLAASDLAAFVFAVFAVQVLFRDFPAGWSESAALPLLRDAVVTSVLFLVMSVRLFRSGRYGVQVEAGLRATFLQRACALALLVHGALILLLGFGEGYELAVWAVLPPVAGVLRRLTGTAFRDTGVLSARALLAGSPAAVAAVRRMSENAGPSGLEASGLEVVGITGLAVPPGASPADGWRSLLARHDAEMVVVAVRGLADEQPMLRSLQQAGVPAAKMIALDEAARPLRPQELGGAGHRIGLHPAEHALKSVADFAGALAMLVCFAPVLAVLAVLVKLDGGPILFRHERVGLRGRMFHCLKFRSMVPNGDRLLRDLLDRDPQARQEWDATRKLRRDPRVTAVGRFLRASSLDELPQLLNVLQGEMSLVGPRPVVPAELPRYGPDIAYYLAAKPGLTGLWQVSGRSRTSYQRRVQLDIAYVRDWSLFLDVRILMQTVPAVLRREGAV